MASRTRHEDSPREGRENQSRNYLNSSIHSNETNCQSKYSLMILTKAGGMFEEQRSSNEARPVKLLTNALARSQRARETHAEGVTFVS